MARKEDSAKDRQARLILEQLNTKTVGPPLSSTGLTGDSAPDTIFTAGDFDKIRNQITLQLSNVEALNLLNTLGQITNMQSQSGPMPGTQTNHQVNITDAATTDFFIPEEGVVYQLVGASYDAFYTGQSTAALQIYDTNNDYTVTIDKISSGGGTATTEFNINEPVFVSWPCKITITTAGTGSGGTFDPTLSVIRVR
jgi:hypothetical protein